jgi:hypothetical protein
MSASREDVIEFLKEIRDTDWLSKNVNPAYGNDPLSCAYYREEDEEHCIAGHFLHYKMGVPNLAFTDIENTGIGEAAHALWLENFLEEDAIEPEAMSILEEAQLLADNYWLGKEGEDYPLRKTWGEVAEEILIQNEQGE